MESVHKMIILDEEDKWLLDKYGFFLHCRGYVITHTKIKNKYKQIFLHHLILPKKKGLLVDHINRNKLDNRRCNLRYVTNSQNMMNGSKRKDNTSGYRGVSWNKDIKKWQAQIFINGKHIGIGCFTDIEEAAKAYKDKATELFKEYIGEL